MVYWRVWSSLGKSRGGLFRDYDGERFWNNRVGFVISSGFSYLVLFLQNEIHIWVVFCVNTLCMIKFNLSNLLDCFITGGYVPGQQPQPTAPYPTQPRQPGAPYPPQPRQAIAPYQQQGYNQPRQSAPYAQHGGGAAAGGYRGGGGGGSGGGGGNTTVVVQDRGRDRGGGDGGSFATGNVSPQLYKTYHNMVPQRTVVYRVKLMKI